MTVCLVIVFNSPFGSNIPILLDLYSGRFDAIFFLTHKPEGYPNAVQVRGESYYYHNFFLQAWDRIRGYDYYVVTHDDAILHPQLNKHNMWTRFAIPMDAICLRNIDIVPRGSSWAWTHRWGYDVVDENSALTKLLVDLYPQLRTRFVRDILPVGLSEVQDPVRILSAQAAPMLFGGGPNADLLFLPGRAFDEMMVKIELLNVPGLFVEIVIPMAAMLTGWPLYLLLSNVHAPTHRPSRRLNAVIRLLWMLGFDRICHHPIKFGKVTPATRRLFCKLYHLSERPGVAKH